MGGVNNLTAFGNLSIGFFENMSVDMPRRCVTVPPVKLFFVSNKGIQMSTQKIDKLTAEQEALMPVYKDKWIKIGLATGPVDFENAKAAAIKAYELAGLAKPTRFYVADGPIHAIEIIKGLAPELKVEDIFTEMLYGNHEAAWLSFYDYAREVLKVKECDTLEGLFDIAKCSGWLSCYEDTVVFQSRPSIIALDDEDRLHSSTGPAIAYPDETEIYCWHGQQIPREWIMEKEKLTPQIALKWPNIETRRCACEIIGWDKIIQSLEGTVVDHDADPEIGTLIEVDMPDIGKERYLHCECGTGRWFYIPVPPTVKTAIEAQAWIWELPPDGYTVPEVRA